MRNDVVVMENVVSLLIEKHGNALYFGHGGADEGFRAELLVNKEKGYGAVVMANSDNGQILREVIRGLAREYGWDEFLPAPYELITLDAAKLNDYTGRFQVNPDRVLTVTNQNGKLIAQPTGDPEFELLPISETTFVRREANIKYDFARVASAGTNGGATNGNGTGGSVSTIESIQITGGSGTNAAKRISADSLVPFELLMAGKTSEALAGYRRIKQESPDNVSVEEGRINNLGYVLMRKKSLADGQLRSLSDKVGSTQKLGPSFDSIVQRRTWTHGGERARLSQTTKSLGKRQSRGMETEAPQC